MEVVTVSYTEKLQLKSLEILLGFLVGGDAMKMINELVANLMDEDKPGAEKKAEVWETVLPYVKKIGMLVLSTAIELAVDLTKAGIAKGVK